MKFYLIPKDLLRLTSPNLINNAIAVEEAGVAAVDREDSLDVPQQLYKLKNEIFDPLAICHLGYSPAADPLLGWGTTVANPEKQQTFGANIYDLLRKEFALEDGFMGEFSRGKMNQVIDSPREHQLIKEGPKNTGRKILLRESTRFVADAGPLRQFAGIELLSEKECGIIIGLVGERGV